MQVSHSADDIALRWQEEFAKRVPWDELAPTYALDDLLYSSLRGARGCLSQNLDPFGIATSSDALSWAGTLPKGLRLGERAASGVVRSSSRQKRTQAGSW